MKTLIDNIGFLLIIALCFLVAYCAGHRKGKQQAREEFKPDTLTYVDTLHYYLPKTKDSTIIRFATIRIPYNSRTDCGKKESKNRGQGEEDNQEDEEKDDDEEETADSIEMKIPIEQKVYEDKHYTAYISGYRPSLDSLILRHTTREIFNPSKPTRNRRWKFGLQAGFGMTPKGLQPYIGIGGSYNLNN